MVKINYKIMLIFSTAEDKAEGVAGRKAAQATEELY